MEIESKVKDVVTSSVSYEDYDLDGGSILVRETYGHSVLLAGFSGVKYISEGCIQFLDGKSSRYVNLGGERKYLEGLLPVRYVIRTWDGKYWNFEFGFDLLSDGRVWVGFEGGTYFSSISDSFSYIEGRIGSFGIFLEEELMIDRSCSF